MANSSPFSLNELDPETRAIAEQAARAAGLSAEEWVLRAILRKVGSPPKGIPDHPRDEGGARAAPEAPPPPPWEAGIEQSALPQPAAPEPPTVPEEAVLESEPAAPAPEAASPTTSASPEETTAASPVGLRSLEEPPPAPEAAAPVAAPSEPLSDKDLLAALNALAAKVDDATRAPAGPKGPPPLLQKDGAAAAAPRGPRSLEPTGAVSAAPSALEPPSGVEFPSERPAARRGLPPKDLDELRRALARIDALPLRREEGAAGSPAAPQDEGPAEAVPPPHQQGALRAAPSGPGRVPTPDAERTKIVELDFAGRAAAKSAPTGPVEPLRALEGAPEAQDAGKAETTEAAPLLLTEVPAADRLIVEPADIGSERGARHEKMRGPGIGVRRAVIAGLVVLAILGSAAWVSWGSIQGSDRAGKLGALIDQAARIMRSFSSGTEPSSRKTAKEGAQAPAARQQTGAGGQPVTSPAEGARAETAPKSEQPAAPSTSEARAPMVPAGPQDQAASTQDEGATRAALPAPSDVSAPRAPAPRQPATGVPSQAESGTAPPAGEHPADGTSPSAAPPTPTATPKMAALPPSAGKSPPASPQEEDAAKAAPAKPGQPTAKTPSGNLQELETLAKRGDARAQHDLATLYARGDRLPKDYVKAAYWFREAALQGVAGAQYNLAVLYEQGWGVDKDPLEALLWYLSAAEQGHPEAQYNVGVAYAEGKGIPQNYVEARKWFATAAEQGLAKGAYNLGVLDELGLGAAKNEIEAYKWYKLARRGGEAGAEGRLEALVKRMKPEQVAEGNKRYEAAAGGIPLKPSPQADRATARPVQRPARAAAGPKGAPTLPQEEDAARAAPAVGPATPPANGGSASTPGGGSPVVSEIQHLLDALGYDPGPADGRLGAKTVAAIRAFQREAGLPVDGQATAELLQYIKRLSGKS